MHKKEAIAKLIPRDLPKKFGFR